MFKEKVQVLLVWLFKYHREGSKQTQPREKPKLYCGQRGLLDVSYKLFLKTHISSFLPFIFSCLTLFLYLVFSCVSLFFLSPFNAMLSLLFFYLFPHPIKICFSLLSVPVLSWESINHLKVVRPWMNFFPTLVHTSLILLLEHWWKM